MNLDKNKLEALVSLPDDALWAKIRDLAGSHGLKLPDATPPHAELERLRGLCSSQNKISMMQAMRIINGFKRGN